MATMNISVTDRMRAWVETKVSEGEYATASDCMRDLLRERMARETKLAALRRELSKGFESGISTRSWDDLEAELRARAAKLG
ncbi:MAG: type II toxin-antitoxin system ParD family antitoxin [Sphingomonas bacterium]|nr:type II toxin-antitoxin system ParD family antitoxin [Sphingomonas bacterium]